METWFPKEYSVSIINQPQEQLSELTGTQNRAEDLEQREPLYIYIYSFTFNCLFCLWTQFSLLKITRCTEEAIMHNNTGYKSIHATNVQYKSMQLLGATTFHSHYIKVINIIHSAFALIIPILISHLPIFHEVFSFCWQNSQHLKLVGVALFSKKPKWILLAVKFWFHSNCPIICSHALYCYYHSSHIQRAIKLFN